VRDRTGATSSGGPHYKCKELNSPNDIIVDSRDRNWFSDPTCGRTSPTVGVMRDCPPGYQGVYRLDPDGSQTCVADDYVRPNALCLMPGEKALLINDTGRKHIRRYDVKAGGTLSGGEALADISSGGPANPDGMQVHEMGRIYCNDPGGVHILAPECRLLGIPRTPE
jgi:gluconolactonase